VGGARPAVEARSVEKFHLAHARTQLLPAALSRHASWGVTAVILQLLAFVGICGEGGVEDDSEHLHSQTSQLIDSALSCVLFSLSPLSPQIFLLFQRTYCSDTHRAGVVLQIDL
jgi:hypothetical protein